MTKRQGEIATAFLCFISGFQLFIASIFFGGIETKLIYHPMDNKLRDIWINTEKTVQDIYFYSRDGIKLNAWYIKAEKNKSTIIYCHGQGENISLWQNVLKYFSDKGYGVFMLEYRGHGKNEGKPYESGLYIDLESAVNYLNTCEKVMKKDIILWGRSLGGAVVADVASRGSFRGVILESAFTNIRSEALHLASTGILESKFGFWRWISGIVIKIMPITQKFENDRKIHKIKSPLLIGHSRHDVTVPVEMSYKLKALNNSAKLYISDSGSHHENDWFFPEVLDFIKSL